MRDAIWKKRKEAKKNGMIIEEWLTDNRARLYKKCKELKSAKMIKDVITEDGDIYAVLQGNVKESCRPPEINPEKQLNPNGEDGDELLIKEGEKSSRVLIRDSKTKHESKNTSLERKLVITDADYENLVKHTKNTKVDAYENMFV